MGAAVGRRRRALLASVVVPTLAACGGGGIDAALPDGAGAGPAEAAAEGATPDFFLACGLLSADEAAEVIAGPSAEGEQSGMLSTETGASDCTWNRADGSSTSLTVTVHGDASIWDVERFTGTKDPERVSGLGDESYIALSSFQDTIGFRQGDVVVFLTTQFANGMAPELTEVAHLVADRL